MKYHSFLEKIKVKRGKNFYTPLKDAIGPGSKHIHTRGWGTFKIRKNGGLRLLVGSEIIRVQLKGSYFDAEKN